MINTIDAALLAQASYNQSGLPVAPTGWSPLLSSTQMASGFTGNAFVNGETLVIGFGGTDGLDDIITDIDLAVGADPVDQVVEGIAYAAGVIAALPTSGLVPLPTNIVFVGHSLGGYIAQEVLQEYPDASAIVFNSPGVGGVTRSC